MQPHHGTPHHGERWNVNMPAIIGVVFVFLVGVIVWVVVSNSDNDSAASPPATTLEAAPRTPEGQPLVTVASATSTLDTTPTPLPVTAPSTAATTAPTSAPTSTTTPVTTAPGADPDAVPGDLAIAGRPMQAPGCDDAYITVIASAVGDQATTGGIAAVLDTYPGSNYLRTDQTCTSLTQSIDGDPIYVVFFGPFPFASDACAARADGTPDAYARRLSNDVGSNHSVGCT